VTTKRLLNFTVIVVCTIYLLLYISALVTQGFAWSRVVWAHAYMLGIAVALVWELQGRKANAAELAAAAANARKDNERSPAIASVAEAPLVSLVLLLRRHASVDEAALGRRLSDTLQIGSFRSEPDADNVLIRVDETTLALRVDGRPFVVVSSPSPYVKDRESEAASASAPELATAIREHSAWRAVDRVGEDESTPSRPTSTSVRPTRPSVACSSN
jgi:hypothetical protein